MRDAAAILSVLFNFVRCPCNVFDVIVSLNQYTVTYLLTYLLTNLLSDLTNNRV